MRCSVCGLCLYAYSCKYTRTIQQELKLGAFEIPDCLYDSTGRLLFSLLTLAALRQLVSCGLLVADHCRGIGFSDKDDLQLLRVLQLQSPATPISRNHVRQCKRLSFNLSCLSNPVELINVMMTNMSSKSRPPCEFYSANSDRVFPWCLQLQPRCW